MPDAVPGADEIILPGWHPLAHVGMVKRHLGMARLRERDHLRGDIETLDFVTAALQQANEAAAASRAHIESRSAVRAKPEGELVLANAIGLKMGLQPLMSNGIVAFGHFRRLHESTRRRSVIKRMFL